MVGKKKNLLLCSILCAITLLGTGCTTSKPSSTSKSNVKKIGITQIIEHPALDASKNGFVKALSDKGFKDGENLAIEFSSAQGDTATTQTIAQNFASQKKDLIFAISTPSAQAAFNATKDIPILITAVTDPVKAGLAKSLEKSETNVTGTSDFSDIKNQFDLIKELLPQAKRVGFIYNTSEANSEKQLEEAKKAAASFSYEIVPMGITSSNEIASALDALLSKVDVLYTPTDNLIASSMSLIVQKSTEKKIAVIGGEKAHVENGALATRGIDYYKLGYETGLMAVDVLNGKKPSDMPIEHLKDLEVAINEKTSKALGISIPSKLKDNSVIIGGN
ncbi:ABC transporter substrate-binding protein [Clostridium peptidivorans]|uniref:ABC transporter substrate-binding protein n=1 Tax=Clostridium peptidivorans TaxID=100174 RepID=UPI000BE4359E|nr:ABC transporter substrate-binding protein [Clostridium peptidivorans]